MSALENEVRAAVRAELADVLPTLIREHVRAAVQDLRMGDAGDRRVGVNDAAPFLATTPAGLRKQCERGTCPVPFERDGRRLKFRVADLIAARDLRRRGEG